MISAIRATIATGASVTTPSGLCLLCWGATSPDPSCPI